MKPWLILKSAFTDLWGWIMDRWCFAKKCERTGTVIGKYVDLRHASLILLLVSQQTVESLSVNLEIFKRVSKRSRLRIQYLQTKVRNRRKTTRIALVRNPATK